MEFVGAEDLSEGKDEILLSRSGDTLSIEFTPREASDSVSIELFDNNATEGDIWTGATLSNMTEDKIFFWNDGTAADNYATHVLQLDSIDHGNATSDDDYEIVIKDLSHNKEYTVTSTTSPVSSDISLYARAGSLPTTVSFGANSTSDTSAASVFTFYTTAGARGIFEKLNFTGTILSNGIDGGTRNATATVVTVLNVTEDVDGDEETSTPSNYVASFTWDATDNEYDISTPSNVGTELGDNDDVSYYLTGFGTYFELDEDENSWLKIFVPSVEVSYDAFLLPVASEVTTSAGSSGGAVALNPIAVGLAILDSEANLGSKPYIVVGGPCANTVAAALMGNNPSCADGFTEGKAIIKLYSDKNALLVAGYSGKDTQGASRVLANYDDYMFDGAELEVVTTNLNSLSVKKVMS